MSFTAILGLIVANTSFAIYASLAYTKWKDTNWFIFAAVVDSFLLQLVWIWAVRTMKDKHQLFVYGQIWDVLIAVVGFCVPFIFGVRLGWQSSLGAVMILVGLFVLKSGMPPA
ncbi:MAG: hypothetical protein EOP06_02300 [Proteobacteria bacterium]|nr:MAG: hypothetical protein EOP06_02300 [Pseudomonadota bacterium]